MKNYTFKKVDEKPMLDSPVWNDVEKATLDNDNFCGENAEKITEIKAEPASGDNTEICGCMK